jgi:sulfatase maturation enzyme AslB (radical SAM superfamily)
MDCPILPFCLGGCPQRRREGKKECSPIRFMLDEYVVALAEELMNRD